MQAQYGTAAESAVLASERNFRVKLLVDWNADGLYTHPLSDMSDYVKEISTDLNLTGSAPSEVLLIEGAGAGELTFTVGGAFNGAQLPGIFSPYNPNSPLLDKMQVGAEVKYSIIVDGALASFTYPQFVGNIRTIAPNRADSIVEFTALDRVEKLRKSIQLPAWAVSEEMLNNGEENSMVVRSHWVIDSCLRLCDAGAGAKRPTFREQLSGDPEPNEGPQFFATYNGGTLPTVGRSENQWASSFPSGTATMYVDTGTFHPQAPAGSLRPQALAPLGLPISQVRRNAASQGILRYWVSDRDGINPYATQYLGFTLNTNGPNNLLYQTIAVHDVMQVRIGAKFELRVSIQAGQVRTSFFNENTNVTTTGAFINIPTDQLNVDISVQWDMTEESGLRYYIAAGANNSGMVTIGTAPTVGNDDVLAGRVTVGHALSISDVYFASRNFYGAGPNPGEAWTPVKYPAVLDRGKNRFTYMPSAKPAEAWQIISDVASAEYAAVFWDEEGIFRFWNSDTVLLKQNSPVRKLSLDDVSGFGLVNTLDSVRNEYTVNAQRKRAVGIVNVYSSSDVDEFYTPGNSNKTFRIWVDDVISPWTQIMPKYYSTTPSVFPVWNDQVQHGYCIQYFMGGEWQERNDRTGVDVQCYFTQDGYLTVAVGNGWQEPIRFASGNVLGAGTDPDQATPAFHMGGSKLSEGKPQALYTRNNDSIRKYGARNLTLEGDWYQDSIEGLTLVGNLAQRTGEPIPATDQIEIAGDPRLQIGDCISIDDPQGFGGDIRLQILGINRTLSQDGGLTDRLTVEMVQPGGPTVDPTDPGDGSGGGTTTTLRTNLQRNPAAADNTDTGIGPGPVGSAFVTGVPNMIRTTGYRLNGGSTDGKWSTVTVKAGKTYRGSVYVKADGADTSGSAHITWYQADNTRIASTAAIPWATLNGQVTRGDTQAQVAPQNAAKARLYIKTTGAVIMTGALFEETTDLRDYFDADTDTARLNDDGTSSIGSASTDPGGPVVFTSPGQLLNIGTEQGKNHFNLGIGFISAHQDIEPDDIEAGYAESDHFTLNADGTAARLRVTVNGKKTSSNTQYPRTEFREYGENNSEIDFNGGNTSSYIKGKTKFVHLPPVKPWAVFCQVHDASSDLMRCQVEVVSGKMGIVVRNTPPGSSTETKTTVMPSYTVGDEIDWKIEIINGTGKLYLNGNMVKSFPANSTGLYYKAGVYLQTNDTIESDPNEYGEVELRDFEHWHTGFATPIPPVNQGPSNPDPGGGTGGGTGGSTGSTGTTAAAVHGWGDPDPSSDTFTYVGVPNPTKWEVYGNGGTTGGDECTVGHDSNGRRCVKNAYCNGEYMRITGQSNGDSTGISHSLDQKYGRWEVRARFLAKTGATGHPWHPVLIVWSDHKDWPLDGEYDFVENDIGDTKLGAFLHYPHPANVATQQEFVEKANVDITEWHNYGFEWTSTGIKGYVDGVQWFSFAGGGGPSGRSNIQNMTGGHLTIQLDNFFGSSGMQEAYMDVASAKVYKLNAGGTGGGGTGSSQTDVNQEKAFELTSTAENSTKNWWESYSYIEDIKDGRGYTGGIVGFTSATGDMLDMVKNYLQLEPTSNPLSSYLDDLQACSDYGDTVDDATYGVNGGGASTIANSRLGSAYRTAWANAANADAIFRQAQRDYRTKVYWKPAYDAAIADGLGPLGIAFYYDTSVNHGPGVKNSNDGSFDDIRSRTTGTKPINGGDQKTWLLNFLSKRSAILTKWGDNPSDGRIPMFKTLINSGNLNLTTPFTWKVYGDTFTMSSDPTPHLE